MHPCAGASLCNLPCDNRGNAMIFRLAISEYDAHTERGYVEFRANDGDGGMIISCILTFRTKSKLSKHEIKHEIVRKARHALKRASAAT